MHIKVYKNWYRNVYKQLPNMRHNLPQLFDKIYEYIHWLQDTCIVFLYIDKNLYTISFNLHQCVLIMPLIEFFIRWKR